MTAQKRGTSAAAASDPDFPEPLCAFIQANIPEIDAAELLLALAANPECTFTLEQLVYAPRPAINEAAARKHLAQLQNAGVVTRTEAGYRYAPGSRQIAAVVEGLQKAYKERPVTLLRLIYALRDAKIRSFADAFLLRKG